MFSPNVLCARLLQIPTQLPLADNQVSNARELATGGVGLSLGWHETLPSQEITAAVEKLTVHQEQRHRMAQLGRELIDGLGAQRVAHEIFAACEK